jgi:hemerythrin-like domain-containing protein
MILRAEHTQIRHLLACIGEALGAVQWSDPQPAVGRARELIAQLQAFDVMSHRPKGVALVGALRGRSAEADRLLDTLEHDREQEDASLSRALALLEAASSGDARAGAECVAVFRQHREGVLHHLEREDTQLFEHTEQLLTEEEWSHVVSSISSALYAAPRAGP